MVPFRNFVGINFRDRMKFWWNSLILMPFLVIFDRYFDNSHKSYISRVKLSRGPLNKRFCGYKLLRTPKKSRNRESLYLPAKDYIFNFKVDIDRSLWKAQMHTNKSKIAPVNIFCSFLYLICANLFPHTFGKTFIFSATRGSLYP